MHEVDALISISILLSGVEVSFHSSPPPRSPRCSTKPHACDVCHPSKRSPRSQCLSLNETATKLAYRADAPVVRHFATTMRLLDTYTGRFVEKDARRGGFKYVILSHTWDSEGEQTFKQLKKIQRRYTDEPPAEGDDILPSLSAIWTDRDLSPKIRDACAVARMGGYRYIWIDSCCIDKTSSAELSEAINSMYLWYKLADACYAFLVDVPTDENPRNSGSSFRQSRWFTRGWTLQELLAPKNLLFLSKDWMPLGWKKELANLVNAITNISIDVLRNPDLLHYVGVAPRLSWAARRETTRLEDRAYSLLGVFDISMPTLYGEGEGAFQRLQEEILKRIPDQSIFAWGGVAYYGGSTVGKNGRAGKRAGEKT